jgi:hypothetical protein
VLWLLASVRLARSPRGSYPYEVVLAVLGLLVWMTLCNWLAAS